MTTKNIDPNAILEGLLTKLKDGAEGKRDPITPLTQEQAEGVFGCLITAVVIGLGPVMRLLPKDMVLGLFSEMLTAMVHCTDIDREAPDAAERTTALEVAGKQAILLYGLLDKAMKRQAGADETI